MKIENRGKRVNILPIGADLVEVPPGTSIEISDEVWANLKRRASISAKVASGELVEIGPQEKAEPVQMPFVEPQTENVVKLDKPKRGRPAKKAGE